MSKKETEQSKTYTYILTSHNPNIGLMDLENAGIKDFVSLIVDMNGE